ncbi:polysaccharide deacetylase family protein [Halochromatium glycolicum]|uniref:DUF2334 domain-containing protein n=1 Tax=Halochromatium glycolicum TaxID=85075 RepID=A0AAJ0U6W6_9GAMM|nr:polysaccharide deacetylase family protein [Halochromatium glycolicum]MBK1706404.1 hypothetical protein [Halochromatium glycolicum]
MTRSTEGRSTESSLRALVSVHDLMPETMPAVRRTLKRLEHHGLAPVTLLVVPGLDWTASGIAELRQLQRDGYRLAGHGWRHHADRLGGLYHRLHSLFLSRRVAEHLALDVDGIIGLIRRCHAWFGDHGLDAPSLYVPPAWAMGGVTLEQLRESGPFPLYERFDGVMVAEASASPTSQLQRLPLLGYEGDNALRVPILRIWNHWNRHRATRTGRPIRIGIHPHDIELRLAGELERDLARPIEPIDYDALRAPP